MSEVVVRVGAASSGAIRFVEVTRPFRALASESMWVGLSPFV
jgi:hypothetical protein